MFRGDEAARALIQLCPYLSDQAIHRAWNEWRAAADGTPPDRVLAITNTAVDALRLHRVPDWERGWELSASLSRLGFLLSFYDERLN